MTTVEKIRLLVVEDNDASASDYVRALEEAGYHVERASAKSDAVELASRRPEVVLLDLQLPSSPGRSDENVQHGLDVLEALVSADPFQPIVVMTAHSNNRELMRGVLQRNRGGQFVFKDADNLEAGLLAAVAVALADPAYTMSRSVRQFRAMLDEERSEDDYRKFIATHWRALLGPEYKDCRSPYEVSRGAEVDLFAVRHDDFPDLWELKRPRDAMFRKYNDWYFQSEATAKAFGQMVDYCDLVRRDSQVKRSYEARKGLGTVELSRPRGFVVIGRYTGDPDERKRQRDRVRLENSYYAGLTLMTYDDLVERAEQFLGFLHGYRPARA